MIQETFSVGMLQCNCTVLGCEETRRALVIDPGDEAGRILGALRHHNLTLEAILLTHAHHDHVCATKALAVTTGAPVLLHRADQPLYDSIDRQAREFGFPVPEMVPVDRHVVDGEQLSVGTLRGTIIHTPGHSPGSLCLYLPDVGNSDGSGPSQHLYSGDTLFCGGVGRTDLWEGSMEQLLRSIRERILTLPDETLVVPGHGPITTIARERTTNPFLLL